MRQLFHIIGINAVLLRFFYSIKLIDNADYTCWTPIDIGDISEEEVTHKATSHHLLRAYSSRNEHHLFGIQCLHLALLILSYHGEEVE